MFGLAGLACLACTAQAQAIRVLKLSDGKPFQMGKVNAVRVVHPDMGAKRLTLNYSVTQPGAEFAQHAHDYSDDTMLILQGQADLRQGDSRKPFRAGQSAFVPAGQIHGTVTTGTGTTIMISFQTPPDLALYTGARDSSKSGAAPPKGAVTTGAVKFIEFGSQNGLFVSPSMGSERVGVAHHKLKPRQGFNMAVGSGGEALLFVWQGAVEVNDKAYAAGERETVFVSGPAKLDVRNDSTRETVVIAVQAPPGR